MRNYCNILVFALAILFFHLNSHQIFAQPTSQASKSPQHTYVKAQVVREIRQQENPYSMYGQVFQVLFVEILEGPEAGKAVEVQYDAKQLDELKVKPGDILILEETLQKENTKTYSVFDRYRLTGSTFLICIFLVIIIVFVGWKGVGSIIGLLMSIGVIFFFIIPQIVAGQDPLMIITIGSLVILVVTTYVAHGFSNKTTIAVLSTFLALFVTIIIALITANISILTGFADENAFLLHVGSNRTIDIHGLLLGGIILGSVGALNDVTTTQAATMFALYKSSQQKTFSSLVKEGLQIGKEHVVSIINTLLLAYAGSSLIVLIFIFSNSSTILYGLF